MLTWPHTDLSTVYSNQTQKVNKHLYITTQNGLTTQKR